MGFASYLGNLAASAALLYAVACGSGASPTATPLQSPRSPINELRDSLVQSFRENSIDPNGLVLDMSGNQASENYLTLALGTLRYFPFRGGVSVDSGCIASQRVELMQKYPFTLTGFIFGADSNVVTAAYSVQIRAATADKPGPALPTKQTIDSIVKKCST